MKIQIIRKKIKYKLLNKIFETDYRYKIDLDSSLDDSFQEVSIFHIKNYLKHDNLELQEEDAKKIMFKVLKRKKSSSRLTYFKSNNIYQEKCSLCDISLEEYSQMRDVQLTDGEIKLLLFNSKTDTFIDILNSDNGYKYLSDLIVTQQQRKKFLGRPNWIECAYYFLSTPILTVIFRVLASVYSTGPFYKSYETSIVFFLVLILLSNMVSIYSFTSIYSDLFVSVLCFKEISMKYIFLKLSIIYLGFLFSLLLSSLLGIPMNILWMFCLFVSFFIYLPIFISLFIFLKQIVK